MRLVDDDRVVSLEERVALRLGEQDAVGHELHVRLALDLVVEAHLVADLLPELGLKLLRDARGHGARRDSARLRMPDPAFHAALHLEEDLRQLGGLSRAGLAADDDDLVAFDGRADVVAPGVDRERGIEFGLWQPGEALGLEAGGNQGPRF